MPARKARFITALLALLLMFAGQAPLVAMGAQAAADSCCPDGHACCRRLRHSKTGGRQWHREDCGSPGCGGAFGVVSVPLHTGATLSLRAPVAPVAKLLPPAQAGTWHSFSTPLDLYQRPPPAL